MLIKDFKLHKIPYHPLQMRSFESIFHESSRIMYSSLVSNSKYFKSYNHQLCISRWYCTETLYQRYYQFFHAQQENVPSLKICNKSYDLKPTSLVGHKLFLIKIPSPVSQGGSGQFKDPSLYFMVPHKAYIPQPVSFIYLNILTALISS